MAIGKIVKIIATHPFDATRALWIDLIQILDNLHCLSYSGPDINAWARSINITAAGAISEPATNTLELNDAGCDDARACVRPDDVVCTCYNTTAHVPTLSACIVNADGTLSEHANHIVPYEAANSIRRDVVHVADSTIAIAYDRFSGDTYIITWSVSEQGAAAAAKIQNFQVDPLVSGFSQIVNVKDNVFVDCYQSTSNYAYARSVNITDAGAVSFTAFGRVAITDQAHAYHHVIKLKNNTFISVGHAADLHGWAAVFQVSDDGQVTLPGNNLYEFYSFSLNRPRALRITDDVFAVVYADGENDGWLKTIKCEVGTDATWTPIDQLEFDGVDGEYPVITRRSDNVFCIAYSSTDNAGILKTVEITGAAPTLGHTELLMGIGP